MTTFDERQQKGKQLCQKLVERIGEVAAAVPLGNWPAYRRRTVSGVYGRPDRVGG